MAGTKRPRARIVGAARASAAVATAGAEVRASRKRRAMKQTTLAAKVGISQARLADIEAGNGGGAPLEVWLALAEAVGRYLKFEFGRDPQAELVDAGHLQMQELVIRLAKASGWEVQVEAPSRQSGSERSIDVRLIDRRRRRLMIVECWNTFGNLGEATRSSNAKVRDAEQQAVAIAGEGDPFEVGLVWVVRDTRANRELLTKYGHTFAARLPGPSVAWFATLTSGHQMPQQPGLVWCDTRATRLFARRRGRGAR